MVCVPHFQYLTSLPSHTSANCPLPNFLTLKTVSLVVAYSSDLPRSKAQMSDRGFMHICCSLQHRPSALSVKLQKMICHKTYIYNYKVVGLNHVLWQKTPFFCLNLNWKKRMRKDQFVNELLKDIQSNIILHTSNLITYRNFITN